MTKTTNYSVTKEGNLNRSKIQGQRICIEITMSQAERRNVSREEAQIRLRNHFQNRVSTIIIAQEKDHKEGFHYHVAILVVTTKYKYIKEIRSIFPEFSGFQLDVKAKKSWPALCAYVTKEEKNPLLWSTPESMEER